MYSQIPNLKQVYFAGGEPLMIKEHKEFAERLNSSSDINEEVKSWIISLGLPEKAMMELNGSQLQKVMAELGKLMMPV
jgi:hypothetical protein